MATKVFVWFLILMLNAHSPAAKLQLEVIDSREFERLVNCRVRIEKLVFGSNFKYNRDLMKHANDGEVKTSREDIFAFNVDVHNDTTLSLVQDICVGYPRCLRIHLKKLEPKFEESVSEISVSKNLCFAVRSHFFDREDCRKCLDEYSQRYTN